MRLDTALLVDAVSLGDVSSELVSCVDKERDGGWVSSTGLQPNISFSPACRVRLPLVSAKRTGRLRKTTLVCFSPARCMMSKSYYWR